MTDLRFDLPDWHLRAACRGMDTEVFFPKTGDDTRGKAEEAKRVCSTCPVKAECLDWAVTMYEPGGVWGGLSERDRRGVRRAAQDEPEKGCVGCGEWYRECACERAYGHQHQNSIPTRILDVLGFDEGWWTPAELAVRLTASENTVQVALYRLRRRGLVVNRDVELAGVPRGRSRSYFSEHGAKTEYRREWRAA